ncbi:MAG TPA: radical SAM protein [Symbiobacteriaceae bacterium]|nr:radical SAM protein [Symbiobacteriaceae bacterium]
MKLAQMLLVLPRILDRQTGREMNNTQWSNLVEAFAAMGGEELFLGGAEPLAFPGLPLLIRRGQKLKIPRVTVYLSGAFLEAQVVRQLTASGVHLLVGLSAMNPAEHDALHGAGAHARAMAALDIFRSAGLQERLGILTTVTRRTMSDLPALANLAREQGLSRLLWSTVPDGGWPSAGLAAMRLSAEERAELRAVAAALEAESTRTQVAPLDGSVENPALGPSRLLRVNPWGELTWGLDGLGQPLGNLKWAGLAELIARGTEIA